jgi:5-methyltetrahydrofolate--homocysteine methyltransferase
MSRIEKWDGVSPLDTNLGNDAVEEVIKEVKKEEVKIPPIEEIQMPDRTVPVPVPPFWGRKVWIHPKEENEEYKEIQELAFEWINKGALFKRAWGYSGKNREEYKKLLEKEILPNFERLKKQFIEENIFQPVIIYGYYPCRSDGNSIFIFPENEGWFRDEDANREPLEDVIGRAEFVMNFPRQKKPPFRCLADYFHPDRHDTIAFSVVSAGTKLSEYANQLYKEGKYKEYYLVHGLGVELAEALAEIVHKKVRIELKIAKDEGQSLKDVNWQIKKYQGARYSPGYPACPDLELNEPIFKLLKPEEYGITLSETYQIHPEQSTDAIIIYHPQATYFSID